MTQKVGQDWDVSYEWKAISLLALGFGLVGLDRFMILPMFPAIMRDLQLGYSDLGAITGVLAITWGISALFTGQLADRFGGRKVVLTSVVVFSLLVGLSGLATSFATLLVIRALMGVADGAYTPPCLIAALEASKPTRHGLNLGLTQTALALFGLAIAPIVVTQLLQEMSWRWIFVLVTPFGLLLALSMYFVLRPQNAMIRAEHSAIGDENVPHRWRDLFSYRNIRHNMIGMLCWITCLTICGAFMPSYLVDYLHLTLPQMGFVLSALGFGGTAGFLLLMLSDHIGRRPVMMLSSVGGAACMLLFIQTGAQPITLFLLLFGTQFFTFAAIGLTVGPISAESVPAGLMASASGLVIFVGEVFGGGIAPIIAGGVAERFGLQYVLYLAVMGILLGLVNSYFLVETAPKRLRQALRTSTG